MSEYQEQWVLFPPWGQRGYLIQYKGPSDQNRYPFVMLQAIVRKKYDDGKGENWQMFRKDFNPKQKETGKYTPTMSFSFSSLPQIIRALSDLWNIYRGPEDAGLAIPEAQGAIETAQTETQTEDIQDGIREFGEFGGVKPTPKRPPQSDEGLADYRTIIENMKKDGAAAVRDELLGFAEFGKAEKEESVKDEGAETPDVEVPF